MNDGSGGPQELSGPKQKGPWNPEFIGFNKFCATIFRAAFHYYYGDIQGLERPPLNSFWVTQMKIGAYNSAGGNDALPIRGIMLGEFINLHNNNASSKEVYATTIHELSHMVHWLFANNFEREWLSWYDFYSARFCESWARGAQWALTSMEYSGYPGGINIHDDGYTSIVIDLIDEDYDTSNNGLNDYKDLVSGYTIKQIQDALAGASNPYEWRDNLKNNYANSTEHNLDALFSAWGF